MSSSSASYLTTVSTQVTIFFGIPILIAGLIGGILNIIVFLSLKTFRQSSCAFYLTTISILAICQLVSGSFTRTLITGFNIDWSKSSLVFVNYDILQFKLLH